VGLRNNLGEEYNPSLHVNVIQLQTKVVILALRRAQCGVSTRRKIGRRSKELRERKGGEEEKRNNHGDFKVAQRN
jgi:hypothetical protein